jgi:hypothetical protein
VAAAAEYVGLTAPEADIIGNLRRGRALWKVGARTTMVEHVIAPSEQPLCFTDQRMGIVGSTLATMSDDVSGSPRERPGADRGRSPTA